MNHRDTETPRRRGEDRGLTAAEVAERVARGQVNRPPQSDAAEYRAIVFRNVVTLFNLLVVPAAIALFLLREYRSAWAVSGMAIANTLIGLVQEVRAKRHLDQLALLSRTRARVRREGQEAVIAADDVVLDDVVLLGGGDPVVVDGVVLEERFLEIDEALLTGESDPVPRKPGDRLLSGSYAVAGDGVYRATAVGGGAFAHQTAAEARQYRYAASPLQQIIDRLIRILSALAVALCLLYVVLYFVRQFPLDDLVQMIAATITSMVPQGLVLMTTLAFTLGAVRMSRRGAVVQRLSAVESMAAVDVLCMDKTGTLTTNRLKLDLVRPFGVPDKEARRLLQVFAWATADEKNKSVQALRAALGELSPKPVLVDQVPFKSQNRYSVVRVNEGGKDVDLTLGAVEALRPHLTDVAAVEAVWREMLPSGLRLLLLAREAAAGPLGDSIDGRKFTAVALLGLADELRPEAKAVLVELAAQGIRFKILSGDNAETVKATVSPMDLPFSREPVVAGDELARATDPAGLIRDRSVFGRVAPQQKLEIVKALQEAGSHVAMIGDGVNDVLPIKRADLGIAMGDGAAATRTVAGLVLETNNFDLLPATLDEGRTILRNVRRAAKLFLLKNVYTLVLIVVATGFLKRQFPYLPQQVTLLNALTIGVPAFLVMMGRQPPGAAVRGSLLREVGGFAVGMGLVMSLGALVVWLGSAGSLGEAGQRTYLLSSLVVMGLTAVVRLSADEAVTSRWDWWLRGWAAIAALLYLAVMYLPPTAYFFELTPLGLREWAVVLALSVPFAGLAWLVDVGWRRWGLKGSAESQ